MGTCLSVDDSSDEEIGCSRSARARRKQRKQHIMEVLAAEAKNNELLFRMPGRMCLNGSSSNACIFTQQGRKGTNQDAMVVWESFVSRIDTTFCGVFDGHGPFGHLVAKKVRDSLPSKMAALYKSQARHEMRSLSSATSADLNSSTRAEAETPASDSQKMFSLWKECFLKAYNAMDKELKTHPTIDCFCSGTTAVTMLLQGQDMVIANVGDSRAVLGTLASDDNKKVEAVQLTVDLKPNLPLEAERIKRCKGRVFALEDEPEVARVWLPHDDSPGLAMARAFGDFCLKDFGLIAVPEVTYTRLCERDQFIVLASDGVWDVLSNKEVVETIWEAPTRTTAARSLVETAVRAWRLKYPTSKVDDCAVVCCYLNKHQGRQLHGVLSSCTAMELVETQAVASEGARLAEFQRSNTLRSGNASDVDDSTIASDKMPITLCNIEGNANSTDASCASDTTVMEKTFASETSDVVGIAALASNESGHPDSSLLSGQFPAQEEMTCIEAPPLVLTDEASSEITVLSEVGDELDTKSSAAVVMGRSASRRSLAECLSVADDDEWSALEGVARVNSLLNLPRFFQVNGDKRINGSRGGSPSARTRSRRSASKLSQSRYSVSKRRW